MRNVVLGVCLVWVLCLGAVVQATHVGAGLGMDPTGIFLVSALTEMPLLEWLDLRIEAGIAIDGVSGLMLATGTVLYHQPIPPIDPFIGLGLGAALTPPPFSTGFVIEGVAGIRVIPFDPAVIYAQIRYIARWSGVGLTTGPVYEVGLGVQF
jgi:hypothetical protein